MAPGPLTYRTVRGPVEATVEERRSVFVAWLRRADDEAAARAVVEEARVVHHDARHHCSAFVLGPAASTQRSSDDGEPAGTAGAPMLEVLTGSGLTDVVAVVTRWFGGTLLGTGGLVRAYSDAVRAAVGGAQVLTRQLVATSEVRVDHVLAGRLEHDLRARGLALTDVRYAEDVTFRVEVPVADGPELGALLGELSGGRAVLVPGSTTTGWRDAP